MRAANHSLSPAAPRHTAQTLLGLAWAMGFAWLPLTRWMHEFADTAHLLAYEAVWWLATLALLRYVRAVERRPLTSIGLVRPQAPALALGVAAGVVVTIVMGMLYLVVLPTLHLADQVANTANARLLAMTPLWWRLLSCVRAAVAEEVMFRGYAMERLQELTGSRSVALWASCAAFTLAHVGAWGWSHVIVVAVGGLAFSLLYLWKRNLWVNITAHLIVDVVSMLG
ncbi:CPBP family intramembrane glutamic endopeptidase [Dyella sp. EPa41]|uniref:CPBP family intramembrane glutamic endopeptidase n=1 Tax=Dyella sp. EPa41 TaxID=1561194 RepID=UPI0019153C35|nr:CPBP family intramembrane glutamic endopeptidase [Dyella sp. EPa41]